MITTPSLILVRRQARTRMSTLLHHITTVALPGHHGVDLHLGQKPKLGGRYIDISLIYISYLVDTLYIHVAVFFLSF